MSFGRNHLDALTMTDSGIGSDHCCLVSAGTQQSGPDEGRFDYLPGEERRRSKHSTREAARALRCAAPVRLSGCQFLWLRHGNEAFTLRLFARQLARPANRLAPLSGCPFRWLLVESSPLQLAKDAFTLHLLLEDSKSLVDIVFANEYLQGLFPS
jgi:hypothetical protein